MFKVIVTWFNGMNFTRTKINTSSWYNITNDCSFNGIPIDSIIKIEKCIDEIVLEDKS